MLSAPKVTALGLSVKLLIVLLRFTQRNSKALNCDAPKKLLRLKYNYPRPPKVMTKSRPMVVLSHKACECVFPCWTPTVACRLYPVWLCVSMLDSHRACISYCVNAGPPQSLYISSCVNDCFHAGLPRSLVYPV